MTDRELRREHESVAYSIHAIAQAISVTVRHMRSCGLDCENCEFNKVCVSCNTIINEALDIELRNF